LLKKYSPSELKYDKKITCQTDKIEYSYWSYRFNSRAKNTGWRIDYFLIQEKYIKNIKKSLILKEIEGSDHAPIKLIIKF
jgi:exodeoxyribonuclease-3